LLPPPPPPIVIVVAVVIAVVFYRARMKILWAKCNDAFLLRSDVTLLPTARLPRANNAGRFCTFKKSQKKGATTVTWFFRFGVSSARCPRASEKNTTHAAHPTRVPPPPAVLLLRIPNHQNKFRKYFASDLGYLPTFQRTIISRSTLLPSQGRWSPSSTKNEG
jgi:hypothetical protein